MNKIIALIFLTITVLTASAQSSGLSVCGIRMGTPKSQAKAILETRFGKDYVYEEDGDLTVLGGNIGGIYYKTMEFHFTWIDDSLKFNGAHFGISYEMNEQNDAIKKRDFIKSVYEKKYDILEVDNDDGFKSYYFVEDDNACGAIWLCNAECNDGKTRLHLMVMYFGPYDESDEI